VFLLPAALRILRRLTELKHSWLARWL